MPHAKVNGISLYYEVEGDGPPLLCISGLGANRNSWALAVPVLTKRHQVIRIDNRGTGRSDVPPGPYAMEDLADDTAALIDHLGVGPVPTVGWSLGGVVLQAMLLDHRDKVSVAVLLSTLPSYTEVQHPWLDGQLALRAAGVDRIAAATVGIPWLVTPLTLSDHARARQLIDMRALDPEPTSYEGYAAQAAGIRIFDRRAELPGVTTPTLVVVGAEDILTPPSQSVEMASLIPGAKLVILPRGGHGALLEYPGPTLGVIEAFLDAHAAS